MKVKYVQSERQWYLAMPQDDWKWTKCDRDVALRAIETGWPSEVVD